MNQPEESARLRAEHHGRREELTRVKDALRLTLACTEEVEKQCRPPECVKERIKQRPAVEKKPRKKREATHTRECNCAIPATAPHTTSSSVRSAICRREGSNWHEDES